jgi:hypothetical protein
MSLKNFRNDVHGIDVKEKWKFTNPRSTNVIQANRCLTHHMNDKKIN